MQEDLLTAIQQEFGALGITLEVDEAEGGAATAGSAVIHLSRRSSGDTYFMACAPVMTFSQATRLAAQSPSLPVLVASDYISEKSAAALRDAGIQYIDASGNAHLEFQDVLIDVRGKRRRRVTEGDYPRRPSNIFSPRRAQVVLALIAWPSLAVANVRDTARAAGVSVGQAHDSLAMLDAAGYLLRASPRLHRGRELLEYWAAAYSTGLGPRLHIASFHGDPKDFKKVNPEDPTYISGEAAATDLIRPTTLTFYVDSLNPRLPILNRWRSDREPNILVRKKFWSSPDLSDGPLAGTRPAPWPLVYADLLASGDPRQRAVAREWRDLSTATEY